MGTLTAASIVSSVRLALVDPPPGLTWPDTSLLAMLNEGQRSACALRPDLYTLRAPIPMVAGTLQAIPAAGTALIRLDQNVTDGQRCRLVDSAMLDAAARLWPNDVASAVVREYAADAKDKKRFHVLPPNNGTGWVVAHYSAAPPVLAAGNAIALDDTYDLALKHFVLGEAYAANTKRQDLTKASFYRQSFEKLLGMGAQATVAMQPKYGATPGAA